MDSFCKVEQEIRKIWVDAAEDIFYYDLKGHEVQVVCSVNFNGEAKTVLEIVTPEKFAFEFTSQSELTKWLRINFSRRKKNEVERKR